MANTFNGIGTTYYGKRHFQTDDFFVATKWFVLGYFPIFPIGSARMSELGSSGIPFLSRITSYDVQETLPTEVGQVIATYIYSFFIVAWCGYLMSNQRLPPFLKFLFITAGIMLPYGLRYFSRMRNS